MLYIFDAPQSSYALVNLKDLKNISHCGANLEHGCLIVSKEKQYIEFDLKVRPCLYGEKHLTCQTRG